ncbi:NAD-dependent epimerase/dehydratase family protein [Pseudomonas sp. Gutcm_11s]|uniref:NAD-dependent epimerase/dehydratase family protein n=1 Tax=Pseudomonas sp. Gutcm_11s TaxID=3026088 RepID=UPI00235EB5AB|nr:NAD(P)-dependent oxidoreductase [Pseudomonas sp. Gutcm_11s]MDD0843876.1 NAD(P)-dependent oxidoreductase [Pseudomonas sp. Gutcm_11s]
MPSARGRVLVTGAGGFVGRQVLGQLLDAGWDVHAVYRPGSLPAEGCENTRIHSADLLVPGAAGALCRAVKPQCLLHLAWCAKPGGYWTSPENLGWVRATLELLESFQLHGGEQAVLVGSCAEYDWSGEGICQEYATPLNPATPYGRCKNATRELAELFAQLHGLPVAWARIFHAYGPFEAPGRLVPAVLGALLKGEPARCSHGEQLRDLLHVADVAAALVQLINVKADGAFNIGGGQPIRLREVIEYLARQLNAEHLVQFGVIPVAANDPPLLVADNQRLLATGWQPRFDLHSGLDDALAWWRGTI